MTSDSAASEGRDVLSRVWSLRCLILLAVGLPLVALVIWYAPPKQERERERDLGRVYQTLADEIDYDRLRNWCGLITVPASAQEVALLEEEARAADPKEIMCSPSGKGASESVGRVLLHEDLRWYRLHNPAEPDRWIGIAVMQHHFTGWSPRWVWCRIRVGF